MIQTQENGKTPHFGPDVGPMGPNLSPSPNIFIHLVVGHSSKILSSAI